MYLLYYASALYTENLLLMKKFKFINKKLGEGFSSCQNFIFFLVKGFWRHRWIFQAMFRYQPIIRILNALLSHRQQWGRLRHHLVGYAMKC